MSITRDALFEISTGAVPGLGPYAVLLDRGANVPTSVTPLGALQTLGPASAALITTTVFDLGTTLGATDPATGSPIAIGPSNEAKGPTEIVSLGATAVFSAVDGGGQTRLWTTNGTSAGTRELNPAGAAANFLPQQLIRFGDAVVFTGSAPDGSQSLWSSDGTNAGTFLLSKGAGLKSGTVSPIGVANGRLVFQQTQYLADYEQVSQLYSTDGTAAGTIRIGESGNNYVYSSLRLPNGILLTGGSYLTSTGLLAQDSLNPPTLVSTGFPRDPQALAALGQGAVFATDDAVFVHGQPGMAAHLWITDGTSAGTRMLDVAFGNNPLENLTTFGSHALFSDQSATGTDLWATDGTEAETFVIAANLDPNSIVVDGGRALIGAADGLYTTDGTAAGTHRVAATNSAFGGILDPTHINVTGAHDQYQLAGLPSGALSIADTVSGRDGAGSYAAHTIAFTDGLGVIDATGNAEAVARLYQAAVGRAPDIGGLISFTQALDAGAITLIQAADIIVGSPEFIGAHPALSDSGFVNVLYENDYHRAADPSGLAAFTGALSAGLSRGAALLDVAESFESRVANIGVAGQANDATVYRLYQAVVDCAPDPNGQQFFSAAMASGLTATQLAADLLGSGEYAARFGAPSNVQFVGELYQNLLHRAVDPSGLATFSAALSAGASRASVAAAVAGGSEARLDTAQATHDGWVYVH